ncbi:MAG: alpha/beta fold hydrolase, partial [Moraxellaceae bacterium]|nr:alpha/beta fold hydrolase [Pseudobdellovibrionaceae bacterium]
MLARAEKFFKGFDNTKLFLQTWGNPKAQATILITHGQAEHSDAYLRLVDGLSKHLNLNFIAWDLRGHGKSEGIRGYAGDFNHYVLDYDCFIEEALKLPLVKNKTLFLLGHSMGGLIQTCALVEKKYTQVTAQILSSPLFGLQLPVPVWKSSAADL